jgi:amidase
MGMRPPGRDDLVKLAALNHFELSEDDLNHMLPMMAPMFQRLDQLDRLPDAAQPLKYYNRDPGRRPAPAEDPFNAILRRCSVKGAKAGKLAGKRVGVKDCVLVAGVPMTCGSLMLDGYIPDRDATIVTRMLDAGAEIVAKLNMDNMAFSGSGATSAFGPVLNPHNPEHLSGGSSGGSGAALYYKDIDLTIGCDQGGSIRIPSSFSGTVGLKPTHGLVPYTDIVGMDPTIDHAGPMARKVADVALLLDVIADPPPGARRAGARGVYSGELEKGVAGLRIGVVREGFGWDGSEADVDDAVRRALDGLAKLGAAVDEISIPIHREALFFSTGVMAEGLAALFAANGMVHHVKGTYNGHLAQAFGEGLRMRGSDLPPLLKLMLLMGTYLNRRYLGRVYAKAQNVRRFLSEQYDEALRRVDVLAMPTTPTKAHRHEPAFDAYSEMMRGFATGNNTMVFDVTGHPSLSVPCAMSGGLPVGLMLTGRHSEDATLLRAGYAYEQSVPWEQA